MNNLYQNEKGNNRQQGGQRGYTLLFAILLTSLVVAIGVSILSLARKELTLTTGARESQFAIYAADSALECAAYWDSFGAFATSSDTYTGYVFCDGHPIIAYQDYNPASGATTTFYLLQDGGRCAQVDVVKKISAGYLSTRIISRGYNKGANPYDAGTDPYWGDCLLDAPDKVERALDYTY